MLNALIDWSLRHRLVVVVLSLVLVAAGVHSLTRLSIDAFPDTTPVQVQVNAGAPALSPEEIEQQVTIPVEAAVAGLPGLESVRSISKFGLSQVTATFRDGTPLFFARQQVAERLAGVELPEGVPRPELGPPSTGLGEIFQYVVFGEGPSPPSLTELTTIHDWVIRPQLLIPGVAEVNTWGGRRRQFQVHVDPDRLIRFDLTMDDVVAALRENNTSVGGGVIEEAGEANVVRGVALTATLEQVAGVVVAAREGVPVRIGDLGAVREGHEIRRGAATAAGAGEVVLGLAFMLTGENSHDVTRRLEARLEEVRASLPPGVGVRVVYRRTELVDRVIETVRENLSVGALLVVAVLFAFLGSLRAGLIVALAIPLSLLCSFSAMLQFGIAASLLSLGAIDFGLVVDSSVIVVENSLRRLGHERAAGAAPRPVAAVVRDAAVEVRRPTLFGELIIAIVYLPILLLEGVEGRLFRPMALTVVFALLSSMVLSLTLVPVLCTLFLPRRARERDNALVRLLQGAYRPFVRLALRLPWLVVALAAGLLAGGGVLAARLGASFIPRLYEEAITINTIRLASVSLEQSVHYGSHIERALLEKFPDEIRDIWTRTGTAEVATDPMGLEVSDVYITLRPRSGWTRASTQAGLTDAMAAELASFPGMRSVFTQPIELRMNELTAGVRADVGVKVFGDDLDTLRGLAAQVRSVIESIPGSADAAAEQVTGQPVLEVRVDQEAIARLGVPAGHVLEVVEALGRIKVGEVREGQRRFDLAVTLDERFRGHPEGVGEILVPTAGGERVPLASLATILRREGPSTITRESQRRRLTVQANVRGRDLGSFIAEARRRVAEDIPLPPGYSVSFGGQFEHYQRARARLMLIVPVVALSILSLLYLGTGSVRDSVIVLTGAPFAALGGVVALHLRGLDFTVSAAVGFIAVSGVSMLSGLVLVSTIRQRVDEGLALREAIERTRLIRLRPILMTALVAALGFVPMALNTGVGAEVQRPLATVVIGGVIADNVLTLLVLPALYLLFGAAGRSPRA